MRQKDTQKKEAILAATKSLLNEVGPANASMSKIARRAGVSAATIYVYFDGKDALLRGVYVDVKRRLASAVEDAMAEGLPVRQTVERAMRGVLQFLLDNREDYLFMEQFTSSPMPQTLGICEDLPTFGALHDIVRKGMREGILKQVDERMLIAYCYLPLTELIRAHLREDAPITEEAVRAVLDMSWDAIRA
ncbi:TetR/AcrR family transcriptional regulator [Eubacteriales bacterium OttesenSCG-928-A19]|nr:TetR/AcrR family transcriptional regulator [Eubacteriales bacterium OttesenSCG-928-A19]